MNNEAGSLSAGGGGLETTEIMSGDGAEITREVLRRDFEKESKTMEEWLQGVGREYFAQFESLPSEEQEVAGALAGDFSETYVRACEGDTAAQSALVSSGLAFLGTPEDSLFRHGVLMAEKEGGVGEDASPREQESGDVSPQTHSLMERINEHARGMAAALSFAVGIGAFGTPQEVDAQQYYYPRASSQQRHYPSPVETQIRGALRGSANIAGYALADSVAELYRAPLRQLSMDSQYQYMNDVRQIQNAHTNYVRELQSSLQGWYQEASRMMRERQQQERAAAPREEYNAIAQRHSAETQDLGQMYMYYQRQDAILIQRSADAMNSVVARLSSQNAQRQIVNSTARQVADGVVGAPIRILINGAINGAFRR